ncbi:unnamed protein product [Microthlaspi erraticum]|uniref:Uncharacterized protein n=1 Tax=Microthlaspi erraticum TaxID=1685480 RepID=A0A6D2HDE9_9BRAS|nr:unnamed protein product [Microthlaspi erraticum]
MCKVEALLKLKRLNEAQTELAFVPKVEPYASPWPASFSQSQTRFFDMNPGAYTIFVKSQMDLALGRFDDAASAVTEALEVDPQNTEIKILKTNVELIQRAVSYSKLEKWDEAVRDYEMITEALPYDKAIAKTLSQAKLALKLHTSWVA